MRCGDREFFREIPLERDLTLAAYWLAHTYRVDPDVFLAKSPDELVAHVTETQRLMKTMRRVDP